MANQFLLVRCEGEQLFRKYEATEVKEYTGKFEIGWPNANQPWRKLEISMVCIMKDGEIIETLRKEAIAYIEWVEET